MLTGDLVVNARHDGMQPKFTQHTIVTSSPITVTSGRRKCKRAVIAAMPAQSIKFPS